MRYSKKHVNKIIELILDKAFSHELGLEHSIKFDKEVSLIKEEHLLIDRRLSSLPEYATAIVKDFLERGLSYKSIMVKYHCSQRSLISLLDECAENDDRVRSEIEDRRH